MIVLASPRDRESVVAGVFAAEGLKGVSQILRLLLLLLGTTMLELPEDRGRLVVPRVRSDRDLATVLRLLVL